MKKLIAAILLAFTLSVKAQNPTLVYGTNGLVTIPANQHTGKVSVSPVISGAISNDLFQFNGSSWVPSHNLTGSNFIWSVGTPGSVIFVGAAGQLTQDNPNFFWDDTNNRLGIGNKAPLGSVHSMVEIFNTGGSPSAFTTNLIFVADNFSTNNIPNFVGRRARGSSASPSAVLLDDDLLLLNGRGYGTTVMTSSSRASLAFRASENWTDANNGTYIRLLTTLNGSSSMLERMRIDNVGNVGIGTNNPAFPLDVIGTIRSISTTGGVIDSTPNNNLDIYANGGAGVITNHAIATLFTGSIDAPTNTAPFITQTSVPSAINVVVTNPNYRTFCNVTIGLTTSLGGISQATLRTALNGVTNDISIVGLPASTPASYLFPISGFIQPNATYWVTNQSAGGGAANINTARSNAL